MVSNPFRRDDENPPVIIIGLGRFGVSVARSLVAMGQEVMAVDLDNMVPIPNVGGASTNGVMLSLVDDAHSAFADLAQEPEVAKHAANPRIVASHAVRGAV